LKDYWTIRREIESEKYRILDKIEMVVVTKLDLLSSIAVRKSIAELQSGLGIEKEILAISSTSMIGVRDVLQRIMDKLENIERYL
jgi:GTPase involved in cell partitioning and DNA repair